MDEVLSERQAADIEAFCDEAQRTDGPTAGARMMVCQACPSLGEGMVCAESGSVMPTKTWIAAAECPLGKW